MRINPEGKPYILAPALASAVLGLLGRRKAAALTALSAAAVAGFFRDPERRPPHHRDLVVSPADGRIIVLKRTFEPRWLKREAWQIGIFMSVLDVHVNRAPVSGTLEAIEHQPGTFLPAYDPEAIVRNERRYYYLLRIDRQPLLVVQVAGALARRTVPFIAAGEAFEQGERIGMIRFGSRVEVYLPIDAEPLVTIGHKVRAGETPLAILPLEEGYVAS